MGIVININNRSDTSTYKSLSPYITKTTSEYIPFYSIYEPLLKRNALVELKQKFRVGDSSMVLDSILEYFGNRYKTIDKHHSNPYSWYTSRTTYLETLDITKHDSIRYWRSGLWFSPNTKIGDSRYITHYATMFEYTRNNNIIPLFVLMVKKEYMDYVKKCIILNKEIRPEVFKLVYNNQFDVIRGINHRVRPHYRKLVMKPLKAMGVEIEGVNTFDEYFHTISAPKASTIQDMISYFDNLSKEVIGSFKAETAREFEEFELEMFN